ncbi:MAG: phenylalanine--tRNA ligase subunit beta [Clostridia bacterium]|nr:phenylalanine--tRNA ligase subunit beta [Clostridia bacterium]
MKLSLRWLKDYVDIDSTIEEFCDKMTISGSKVESFEKEGKQLKNIVVGKVVDIYPHEDSDHMFVCKVDVGDKVLQIVTGAQNVNKGDFAPVALDGSTIFGNKEIKSGILRGVLSDGMLCSLAELGLSKNDFPYAIEDGIFILGDDVDKTIGKDIKEAIGLNDDIIDFEITSNRADCLSILGLAVEAGATFDKEVKIEEPNLSISGNEINDLLSIEIEENSDCLRYMAGMVKNIKIQPSPLFIRQRLRACGVRPINNIVDITNFVMLEYGQPMHAFDSQYVNDNKIIVRKAKENEKIKTLDDTDRVLLKTDTVIADSSKPIAVAGIMGGEFSGITKDTKNVIFESACFNGPSVRRTSQRLGLRTEASNRFEKSLTPELSKKCLFRALELCEKLGVGEVVTSVIDCYPEKAEKKIVDFDYKKINEFIGINLSYEEQKNILEKVRFKVNEDKVEVPFFRIDIDGMEDLSEEIARFYGYDKIPSEALKGAAVGGRSDFQNFEISTKNFLQACGLSEIYTYSFFSESDFDMINLEKDDKRRKYVKIQNPLGDDTSILRTTALPSMLKVLTNNYNFKNPEVKLYEIAAIYEKSEPVPKETQYLTIGGYGKNTDFYEFKGIIEELCKRLNINNLKFERSNYSVLHPGKSAKVIVNGIQIGQFGQIHPNVKKNYDITSQVFVGEFDLEKIYDLANFSNVYKPLPKYPSIVRDLALVCDEDLLSYEVESIIKSANIDILESVELFDIYKGDNIPAGKKSLAYSLIFRSKDKTLTDRECDESIALIIKKLADNQIVLREI